MRSTPLQG